MSKSTISLRSSASPMPKPKIVVTDSAVWVPKLYEIGDVYQSPNEGLMPREKLLEQIKDAEALFCLVRDKVDKELLDQAKNLKVVATMSVGYDHVDVAECKKRGIVVGNTPGVLTEATAELGMALLLATSRRIRRLQDRAESGRETGSIQTRKIIYHNRSPVKEGAEQFTYVSFKELLKESDFLIITMKNDSILVNISRGSLVNLDDLQHALQTKQIGAAGLDVTEPEPLPSNHPLFSMDKCVILPTLDQPRLPREMQWPLLQKTTFTTS
uniref:D-isomer specific 2-hydroxyacid dehydrogenase catalytic domain-containing protein n=1 Tax=Ditylenchus dipsaci TaxID=166011 RepID=A0A915EDC0_9BILA